LNILPELAGLALALDAYVTLIVGLPIYLVPLMIRIRQEEAAMTAKFDTY
jgi:isoprenylcysteine carboxyl methyltransferase (ICMT) family protein YpbQ